MGQCRNVTFGSFLSFRRVLQQTELVKLHIYYNSQILFFPLYSHNFLVARENVLVVWASVQTSVKVFPLHGKAIKIVFSVFKALS